MNNQNAVPWEQIDQGLRRLVASARAAEGMSWEDVSLALGLRGWEISASNLMTRYSRMSFRADEILLILSVLGVKSIPIRIPVPKQ